MGLVAPRHVGASRTRDQTRVPCIGRRILNHCTTREVPKVVHWLIRHQQKATLANLRKGTYWKGVGWLLALSGGWWTESDAKAVDTAWLGHGFWQLASQSLQQHTLQSQSHRQEWPTGRAWVRPCLGCMTGEWEDNPPAFMCGKFYSSQTEDYNPGDSQSVRELWELLQKGKGGGQPVYMWFWWRGYLQSSTHLSRRLLLVLRDKHLN